MILDPYSYQERKGVKLITWQNFHELCKGLAMAVSDFNPDIILGIGRGGFYPATMVSQILQKEIYPVRLTRRVEDIVMYEHPRWLLKPPPTISGLRVLVVDEICRSGDTLSMVITQAKETGASEVRSAVLYSHLKGQAIPNYIGIITDELILNPWDREIYKEGKFIFHPEYANALYKQGLKSKNSYLPGFKPTKLAKTFAAV